MDSIKQAASEAQFQRVLAESELQRNEERVDALQRLIEDQRARVLALRGAEEALLKLIEREQAAVPEPADAEKTPDAVVDDAAAVAEKAGARRNGKAEATP